MGRTRRLLTLPLSAVLAAWVAPAAPVEAAAAVTATAEASCPQPGAQAIDDRWNQLGGADGRLGASATPSALPVGDGCWREYQGGDVYWSDATGAWEVFAGPAHDRYVQLGGPEGRLGFPTRAPLTPAGGTIDVFLGGRLYWSEATGAHPVHGAILRRYIASGGTAGPAGFPTTDEQSAGPAGSRVSAFARGRIYWSSATAARLLTESAILTKYVAEGAARSALGLPTSERRSVTGGGRVDFQRGRIYWSAPHGAHVLEGAIATRYVKTGGTTSYVGMPMTDTYRITSGLRNRFVHGQITYFTSSRTTRITGTWRPRTERVTRSQVPYTYRSGCPVGPSSLRRVKMPYYDWSGVPRIGNLIVRYGVGDDVQRVFRRAFDARFSIRKIRPVDVYRGSDVRAMEADNTSAFNCRKVTGNPYRLSQHSYGNAIDINTFENPYVTSSRVYPSGSGTYLNRSWVRKGMIVRGGAIATGMTVEGWPWGARWSHPDYQHFSSNGG